MTDRLGQAAIQVLASGGIRQLSAASQTGTSGGIKWHPGHYMGSNTHIYVGRTVSSAGVDNEISVMLGSGPNVRGIMARMGWGVMHTALNTFDFSIFDQVYTLVTGISKPGDTPTGKRVVLALDVSEVGSTPTGVIPPFIYNNPGTYGAGTDGIHGGYFNLSALGIARCGICLWRPAITAQLNAFIAAWAAHVTPYGYTVDTDPYIEGFMSWELTEMTVGTMDYTLSALITQYQSFFQAAVAALPHTSVIAQNNYLADMLDCANMTVFLKQNRCGISSPDLFGETCILNQANLNTGINVAGCLTDGYRAYIGSANAGASFPTGFSDLRGLMPCWPDVQEPELDGFQFHGYGSGWVPKDIFDNANLTLSLSNNGGGVSHIFWAYLTGNSSAIQDPTTKRNTGTSPGNWGSVLTMINANPVPFTGAPASYASINTA